MSQKIDDILQILTGLRKAYSPADPEPLRSIRTRLVHMIAKQRCVDYQTIANAYIRGLTPNIAKTSAFDGLAEEWLASGSRSLQLILESHAIDRNDGSRIRMFFA